MEPQIRYVLSADGTRIAYTVLGSGKPLVVVPHRYLSTIEVQRQVAQVRENLERLAQRRSVVLYDHRGHGLSEREVTDLSPERCLEDLEAVIGRLASPRTDLLGYGSGGSVAVMYAAANPDRVARLAVHNMAARGRDVKMTPVGRAYQALFDVDWRFYVQVMVLAGFGWTESGRIVADAWADAVSPEVWRDGWLATRGHDVTEYLPRVECATLVVQPRKSIMVPIRVAKEIAASIPNARLLVFDSDAAPMLFAHDWDTVLRTIEQFLDEDAGQPGGAVPAGTAVILFADIVDSTALTERLGDAAFRHKARDLDAALRTIIRENAGTAIEGKLLGDGVLAVFTSARQAIEAALACGRAGNDGGLPLHLGLHAGDVIREDNNVYGGAVNIAARISGLSAPGEVLISDTVRSLARTSAGVSFEDRGEQVLKGVGEPVRVWAVATSGGQASA